MHRNALERGENQPCMPITNSRCLRVQFFEPVDGQTDYYFGSVKAIYARFTPAEIGLTLGSLYVKRVSETKPVVTSKCRITRIEILRVERQSCRGE